jgi:hypothetical protein
MFQIEKNVPLPTTRLAHNSLTATLRIMEPGDSIVVPRLGATHKILSSAACAAKRIGIKVATRKISDTHLRIWRIS